MRILVVSNYTATHLGGIERVAEHLCRGYHAAGHAVRWAAYSDHTGDETTDGITTVCLSGSNRTERRFGLPFPLPSPRSIRRLKSEVGAADVVHIHDCLYATSQLAGLFCRLAGKPFVVTQHIGIVPFRNVFLRALNFVAYRTAGRWLLNGADRVVFCNLTASSYFERFLVLRRPAAFIINGVNPKTFYPLLDGETRNALRKKKGIAAPGLAALFVGRFVEKKGFDFFPSLCRACPDVHFVFVGSGPVDPRKWGLSNVTVVPAVSQEELRDFYALSDVLLLPSSGEGFPLVVQEAMACGLGCVVPEETAVALPGAKDLLSAAPLETAAWVSALRTLLSADLSTPAVRARRVAYAVEHWDWNVTAAAYLDVLYKVLEARQAKLTAK